MRMIILECDSRIFWDSWLFIQKYSHQTKKARTSDMQITIDETLRLTGFSGRDRVNMARYLNDPVVYRNTLRVPYPYTDKDADEWLELSSKLDADNGMRLNWAIRTKSGELIGGIGRLLTFGKESHQDEIGYWLARPYRGQGVMTKVVAGFCDYLFDTCGLDRIIANTFSHNPASGRVLEKVGFRREGYLRRHYLKDGEFIDGILFGMLRTDRDRG